MPGSRRLLPKQCARRHMRRPSQALRATGRQARPRSVASIPRCRQPDACRIGVIGDEMPSAAAGMNAPMALRRGSTGVEGARELRSPLPCRRSQDASAVAAPARAASRRLRFAQGERKHGLAVAAFSIHCRAVSPQSRQGCAARQPPRRAVRRPACGPLLHHKARVEQAHAAAACFGSQPQEGASSATSSATVPHRSLSVGGTNPCRSRFSAKNFSTCLLQIGCRLAGELHERVPRVNAGPRLSVRCRLTLLLCYLLTL